ncbi:MAG: hypothetical protein NTY19_23570 [Planctomycetota bacterium]|nr:hypothetical protein [Planctomycetota bacterium]
MKKDKRFDFTLLDYLSINIGKLISSSADAKRVLNLAWQKCSAPANEKTGTFNRLEHLLSCWDVPASPDTFAEKRSFWFEVIDCCEQVLKELSKRCESRYERVLIRIFLNAIQQAAVKHIPGESERCSS